MIRFLAVLAVCAACAGTAFAADPPSALPGCVGSTPLGRFRLSISCPWKGGDLPLENVSIIPSGARLIWDPVRLSPSVGKDGEIAALVVSRTHGDLIVLPASKANRPAQWDLPRGASVIALVLGADGLNMGKVESLVAANLDLLPQLAAYAQQTSQVETLVQALADSERTGGGADAALRGFSSRWGLAMPKLDASAPPSQQASTLLSALLPAAAMYDPLARGSQMQQTTGLAASVAGLFFGNTVGLAAGGAALVANLKGALFPGTSFHSAYAQSAGPGVMAFCAKSQPARSRTRTAYLWAYQVPGMEMPSAAISGPSFLPLGSKSSIKIRAAEGSNVKDLARARDWRLVPVAGGAPVSVGVALDPASDSLQLDLTSPKFAAGDYELTASWDWDALKLGQVHLRPYSAFRHVQISPASADKLVQGSGVVTIEVTGADFEFVEKAALQKAAARPDPASATTFALPSGPRGGEQTSMTVDVDTTSAGAYMLLLTQSDGVAHSIPLTVLPPNPKLSNLPVRVNAGEPEEAVRFEGDGLERIEGLASEGRTLAGAPDHGAWRGTYRLPPEAKVGDRFPLMMRVKGLNAPVTVPDAILVAGPRPRILSARDSLLDDSGIELREGELPVGTRAGFVISVTHLNDPSDATGGRPRLELACRSGELRKALSLSADEPAPGATLSLAGADSLYLALDPAAVGYRGCELAARVSVAPRGASDEFVLGRVVRLPNLEKFTLTSEAAGPGAYAGILEGRDLDLIEKAGWDAQAGLPVAGIPAPISPSGQRLRLALPWPAPAPHAPLYIWLRGEQTGRRTKLTE